MTAPMVTLEAARTAAATLFDRRHAEWATDAGAADRAGIELPLHPPTETVALRDTGAAADWIASWRQAEKALPGGAVKWASRRWANLGTQQVPIRLTLAGVADVARFAHRSGEWTRASERAAAVLGVLPTNPEVVATLRRKVSAVVALDDADLERLVGVLTWLQEHPDSRLFVRQLPIRGVHTKWIERHRSLVTSLVAAATGRADLGLMSRPELLRLRLLDGVAIGGVRDLSAPLADVSALEIRPPRVLVVENLESMLALPPLPGVVALHGQGYLARVLGRLPWVQAADVLYWGDLDTDGFNILSIAREKVPQIRSILMDRATVEAYRDLCVPDPKPRRSFSGLLTDHERDAVRALGELGDVRLEQERIPWGAALAAIDTAVRPE